MHFVFDFAPPSRIASYKSPSLCLCITVFRGLLLLLLLLLLFRRRRPLEHPELLEVLLHLVLGVGPQGDARGDVLGVLDPQLVVHAALAQLVGQLRQGIAVRDLRCEIVKLQTMYSTQQSVVAHL